MERPTAETIAYYDAAVPRDPRARKGVMFAHPAAFVNGNMFYGTFHQTVIVRVGEARAAELAKGKVRVFEPRPGRVWKEYVQVDAGALPKAKLAALAKEALDFTDALPPKAAKGGKKVAAAKKPAVKASKGRRP
jgi:hypothetical protein